MTNTSPTRKRGNLTGSQESLAYASGYEEPGGCGLSRLRTSALGVIVKMLGVSMVEKSLEFV